MLFRSRNDLIACDILFDCPFSSCNKLNKQVLQVDVEITLTCMFAHH